MTRTPSAFRFDDVDSAPARPGLYAWYHQLSISSADIEAIVEQLTTARPELQHEIVSSFLLEQIFRPYQEADYDVELKGRLKPEYRGRVTHQPKISELLRSAIIESPQSLHVLKDVLAGIVPFFASPIYIGVATKSLRQRLCTHRDLLVRYRETELVSADVPNDEDHSFAYEAVCVRRIVPTELLVYTMPVQISEKMTKGAEYILNRINYPLCGRN
jgi:hypothetical protein